jgi:nucleoside-diphosphate-sugar epimerase
VPSLVEHGYSVDVMDLLWFGNWLPKTVKVTQRHLLECTEADLTGYDQVIFLGGLSNDPMAEFSPAENFVQNGAVPAYLAFVAKKAGVRRLVYASSCSVYGYTLDKLYDEEAPVTCAYPYGISKLQGERAVLQLADRDFSVISLRQGTVCGWSPRMRFDLIVNTMFKAAVSGGTITVNNPSIWRPVLDIRDTVAAFTRAIQANARISGVFNVASGNYTVGQTADLVKERTERLTGQRVKLDIRSLEDLRNYKVSLDRARIELGFEPQYSIKDIVDELHEHLASYGDLEQEQYYNIRVFNRLAARTMQPA